MSTKIFVDLSPCGFVNIWAGAASPIDVACGARRVVCRIEHCFFARLTLRSLASLSIGNTQFGYSSRSATIGSTFAARRAGM
jgi:hypothetical protein